MHKMQTEVPTLPVVHFNTHKNLNRKQNSNLEKSLEAKCSLPHKNITCLSFKKKNLNPLLGRPYQVNIRQQPSSEHLKLNKNSIEQRVLSAKMLRIKELQNQLADAHYQLNELGNENKLLKSLQKRQDSALKRYEGTDAELPRIINSHHEELRAFQAKYKKLKALQKETCDLLKEKENELQQLQCQNKHLLQLSKDRNLEEREKLQLQVSDLNHRIQQQQDTIQTLHRKLALESKSLKHQLRVEGSKRKEAQKNLDEAIEKLRSLENLLDNRERRLYSSGQLLLHSKNRRFGTQSLTNLRDISSTNPLKLSDKCEKWQTNVENNTLPMLRTSELNDKDIKGDEEMNSNRTLNSVKTETMANLEQVRKYRLQKSSHRRTSSNDSEEKFKDVDFAVNENSNISINLQNSQHIKRLEENVQWQYELNADTFKKIYKNPKYQNSIKLSEKKFTDSSGDSGSEDESENLKNNYINTANSRQLHRRLIGSTDKAVDVQELTFPECKDKLEVLVQGRKNSYKSDLEIESEFQERSVKHHFPTNHENDTLKLISPTYDDQTRYDFDKEIKKLLNRSGKIDQNLIHEMHMQTKNIEDSNVHAQYNVERIKQEDINTEDIEKRILEQTKREESSDLDTPQSKSESLLQSLESKDEQWIQNNGSFITHNGLESIDVESKLSHINENLIQDLRRTPTEDSLNITKNLDGKQTTSKIETNELDITNRNTLIENYDVETKNKLNKQEGNAESNVQMLLNNVQSRSTNLIRDTAVDVNATTKISTTSKPTNYIKEQLLASMKAIDDNENIEFLSEDYEKHGTNKKQSTENLFRGLPIHAKKKQDIIKDIFDTDVIKNESVGSNKFSLT